LHLSHPGTWRTLAPVVTSQIEGVGQIQVPCTCRTVGTFCTLAPS
jgi:hypothetical protein